jgi:hypothetical protein
MHTCCKHVQVLPDGAPGVAKGGETRTQTWCCGGAREFDGEIVYKTGHARQILCWSTV